VNPRRLWAFLSLALLALSPAHASKPLEAWYGLYLQGAKVGYSYWRLEPTASGFRLTERTTVDLNMLGMPKRLSTHTQAELTPRAELRRFTFRLESPDQNLNLTGQVRNHVVELAGKRLDTGGLPAVLNAMVPVVLHRNPRLQAFALVDPSTFTVSPASVEHLGQDTLTVAGQRHTAQVFRIAYLGTENRLYLDTETGLLLKETSPMAMTTVLEPQEQALQLGGQRIDILRLFSIQPVGLEGPIHQYRYLKLELTGLPDPTEVPLDLSFASQRLVERQGNRAVLEILKPEIPQGTNSSPLPESLRVYLEPTDALQVDDPEIQNLARQLTAGITDPVEKARRILDYVYRSLEKRPSVTLPTALEVLHQGYGDCNEHSVLFAALARAAGVPTRITVGLVYQGDAYYYHAWDAVYAHGQWFFVDPVMGEFPASIGHILLKIGGIEEQARLLPIVGVLRIRVLDAR